MNFTKETIKKARQTKSAEELLALAKENGVVLTEDEAKAYFADLHKESELEDEELDNVAGGSFCVDGSTYSEDPPYYLIVTMGNHCPLYVHNDNAKIGLNKTCYTCNNCVNVGIVYYCHERTFGNDPYR